MRVRSVRPRGFDVGIRPRALLGGVAGTWLLFAACTGEVSGQAQSLGGSGEGGGAGRPAIDGSAGSSPSHESCGVGKVWCGDECVSLTSSATHCGDCDQACAAPRSCREGVCSCPPGFDVCGGSCVALSADPAHCGQCGRACEATQACVGGSCACGAGQVRCSDGACRSIGTDARNCGVCGNVCGAGLKCANGNCVLDCPTGQTGCGDSCVRTDTDPSHCGGCNKACGAGQQCTRSSCRCTTSGLTTCGTACADTKSSEEHCGGCNRPCSGECVDGTCQGGGEPDAGGDAQ